MSDELVITVAGVGAEVTRAQQPNLPLLPEEVGEEYRRAHAAGASIGHIHGRRPDGTPTQDLETFRAYARAIRERSPIIQQFSTGGAVGMGVEERIAALELRPDMATLTLGTCNFGDDVFENSLPTVRAILERLRKFGITPELEIFDDGMLGTAETLFARGVLQSPLHFDFVLGVPGAAAATAENLLHFARSIPDENTHRARYLTGTDELFDARADVRTDEQEVLAQADAARDRVNRLLEYLDPRTREVIRMRTGLDGSEYAVRRYGRTRNIRLARVGQVGRAGLKRQYDLVVCSDVLHYVPTPEMKRGLAAMRRLCRGVAFLEIYTGSDEAEGDDVEFQRRSAATYLRHIRAAGFERFDRVKDRLAHQHHAGAAAEGAIIDRLVPVYREIPDVDAPDGSDSALHRPACFWPRSRGAHLRCAPRSARGGRADTYPSRRSSSRPEPSAIPRRRCAALGRSAASRGSSPVELTSSRPRSSFPRSCRSR